MSFPGLFSIFVLQPMWLDWPALYCFPLLTLLMLGLQAASLLGYFLLRGGPGPELSILIILGSVQAAVLRGMGIGLAVLATQSLRRLPPVPAGPESWSAPAR